MFKSVKDIRGSDIERVKFMKEKLSMDILIKQDPKKISYDKKSSNKNK